MLRAGRLGSPRMTLLTTTHQEGVSGAQYLHSVGRSGRLVLPGGETVGEVLPELPADERISPGWKSRLGALRLRALGAEPYRRGDGRSSARPLMVLAGGPEGDTLFADLSNGWTVRAAAEEFERRGLRADLVVVGFAWRPARDSARLLRATGARLALVKLSAFESGEPAGEGLLKLLRSCGIRPFSTHECGTLRATLRGGDVLLERFDRDRWAPLGRFKRRPARVNAGATGAASSRSSSGSAG
jgi:hypothetical protein